MAAMTGITNTQMVSRVLVSSTSIAFQLAYADLPLLVRLMSDEPSLEDPLFDELDFDGPSLTCKPNLSLPGVITGWNMATRTANAYQLSQKCILEL